MKRQHSTTDPCILLGSRLTLHYSCRNIQFLKTFQKATRIEACWISRQKFFHRAVITTEEACFLETFMGRSRNSFTYLIQLGWSNTLSRDRPINNFSVSNLKLGFAWLKFILQKKMFDIVAFSIFSFWGISIT